MIRSTQAPGQAKITWFILFFALVISIGMFGIVGFIMQQSGHPPQSSAALPTMRPICYTAGILFLLISIAWTLYRLGLPCSPGQFQSSTIVAMALSEACAIFGLLLFFLGAPLIEFARFAGSTIAVDLLLILPAGIRYWSAK